jgi:hypothetical protein
MPSDREGGNLFRVGYLARERRPTAPPVRRLGRTVPDAGSMTAAEVVEEAADDDGGGGLVLVATISGGSPSGRGVGMVGMVGGGGGVAVVI